MNAIVAGERRALPRLARIYIEVARGDAPNLLTRPTEEMLDPASEMVVATAYHEAAHAVALWHLLRECPVLISIERGSDRLSEPTWGFIRRESANVRVCPTWSSEPRASRAA